MQQRPGIGVPWIGQQVLRRPLLHHLAGIHDENPRTHIGDHPEIMADQDHRGAQARVQLAQQIEDLRLDGDVERGGRLIGDQQCRLIGKPHRQHHPLAHAAGELMRIRPNCPIRRRHPHPSQQFDRPRPGGHGAKPPMRRHRLHQLPRDPQHRVERGHRVLKHHRDFAPAHRPYRRLIEPGEVAPAKHDFAAHDPRGLIEQPHDGFRQHRLARAGLPHDPQRLPRVQ